MNVWYLCAYDRVKKRPSQHWRRRLSSLHKFLSDCSVAILFLLIFLKMVLKRMGRLYGLSLVFLLCKRSIFPVDTCFLSDSCLVVVFRTRSSPILITVCEKWIREPTKETSNRTITADLSSHDNVGTTRRENVTLKSSIEEDDDTVTL